MNAIIHEKTDEITRCLCDLIDDKNSIKNLNSVGLFSGEFGIFMYLIICQKHFSNVVLADKLENYIEDLVCRWANNPYFHTYCGGLAGILDSLDFLKANQIFEIDIEDAIDTLENHLVQQMLNDMRVGRFDYLHGALGPAMYFLDKGLQLDQIEMCIELLYVQAVKGDDGSFKWSAITGSGKDEYNICLSHGISSIIVFLSEALNKGLCQDKVTDMLYGAITYIMAQKFDRPSGNGSIFSSVSKENSIGTSSRLAWCYGDLGIAVSLWQAGKALNDYILKNEAKDIVRNSIKRTDPELNMVSEAGICHGSAGIVMMYQYFGDEMGIIEAYAARDYWITITINMSYHKDGPAGYKQLYYEEDTNKRNWRDSYILIDGIAGIGLVLLSILTKDFLWRKMFLLR